MTVKSVRCEPGDKLLVPGDMHFDLQDQGAIDLMIRVAIGEEVNSVCLVGDTFESAGISRHKSMRAVRNFLDGGGTFKSESEAAEDTFDVIRNLADSNKLHALCGNHEGWFSELQDEYPAFMGMEWYELYGNLFDGFAVHSEATSLKYGPLLVAHGHRLRGSLAKSSAASVLANYPGQNTAYGHTHRIDEATTPTSKYGVPVSHGAWTFGHLKSREIEMADKNIGPFSERHQQGFGLISFFSRGRRELGFNIDKVRIHRDTRDRPLAVVGGKVYV